LPAGGPGPLRLFSRESRSTQIVRSGLANQRCGPCPPAYSLSGRLSASPSTLREIPVGWRSGESSSGGAILRRRVRPVTNSARVRIDESLRTFERDEVLWSDTHSQMPSNHDSTIGLARAQSQ